MPGSPPFEVRKRFHIEGGDHKFLSPGTKFPATQRHIAKEEISQVHHQCNLNLNNTAPWIYFCSVRYGETTESANT